MRHFRLAIAGLILCVSCPATLHAAASAKPSCKKIRDAVWAGKTIDQITAEFDTDAETVMKCTQKRGKRKGDPKAKRQKTTKSSSKSSKSTSSTGSAAKKSKSSTPSVRKPSAPHGPWPKHLP